MRALKIPENAFHPGSVEELYGWLARNHEREAGTWLVLWKKESGRPRLNYDELVEALLSYGWIDSKPGKLDDHRSMLWIAPRKPGTSWSQLNKQRAENAIKAGRMTEAGLAKIKAAKKDGSWQALDEVESLTIPPDLAAAFETHTGAAENFQKFPRSAKRAILEWISNARTDATRKKRLDETARKAALNERANQWRQLKSPPR